MGTAKDVMSTIPAVTVVVVMRSGTGVDVPIAGHVTPVNHAIVERSNLCVPSTKQAI